MPSAQAGLHIRNGPMERLTSAKHFTAPRKNMQVIDPPLLHLRASVSDPPPELVLRPSPCRIL